MLGTGASWIFFLYSFIPFSQGWALLAEAGRRWGCALSSFLSSTTSVPPVTAGVWTNRSSSKSKSLQFPVPGAHGNGSTGPGASTAVSLSPALGRENPSLSFCLCGRDSSHGTEVPQHRPWEKVDLKTVVGDCLNISPFFFIRLRGFAVSVTPLRDRSSSLFGCEYLTSF